MGIVWRSSRDRFGFVLKSFWDGLGIILALFWTTFGSRGGLGSRGVVGDVFDLSYNPNPMIKITPNKLHPRIRPTEAG